MIEILKLIFCLPFLLQACKSDLKTRTVPNKILISMLLFSLPFICYTILQNNSSYLILAALSIVFTYIILWILFQIGVFGGADAKVLIVLSIIFSSQPYIALSILDNAVLFTSIIFIGSIILNLSKGNFKIKKYDVPFLLPITAALPVSLFYGDLIQKILAYILV